MTIDPVHVLAHDHADINRRVLALGTSVAQLDRDGQAAGTRVLAAPLGELREILFLHFAREEEGLFPFVAETFPALADRVREMETAHDAICGAVARMFDLATTNASLAALVPVYRRFEAAYAQHANSEATLLTDLERRLDPAQRAVLGALVEGL